MSTPPLRSPFVSDVLFGATGVALTFGWFELPTVASGNVGAAFVMLGLWGAEHLAFALRARQSLLQVHTRMPDATEAEFARAMPSTYGTMVGALLRAGMRMVLFGFGLAGLGLAPGRQDDVTTWIMVLFTVGELVFAIYWMAATMRTPARAAGQGPGAPTVEARHHAPTGSWLARQLDRARTNSPAMVRAAELVLMLWSSLLFATFASMFGSEMAAWMDGPEPMSPLPLTALLVFATGLLALVLHIPLHLDLWLERVWSARTPAGRWQLRLSAWFAMAMGLGPAWLAWWRCISS